MWENGPPAAQHLDKRPPERNPRGDTQRGSAAHALHPPAAERLQELRRSDRPGDPRGADRRRRPERLRQVEPARGAALGDGREPAHRHARRRDGGRDLRRRLVAAGAQLRRGGAGHRQFRTAGAGGLQRGRSAGDRAADHPRRRLGLQGQRPRRAGARRADAVRRRLDRRAFAGAGAAGADQRADQRPAQGAAADPGRGGGDLGALCAPPRGRAEAEGGRGEPVAGRRRDRAAGRAACGAGPAGAAGGALPRDRRGAAPGRGDAALAPLARGRRRAGGRRGRAGAGGDGGLDRRAAGARGGDRAAGGGGGAAAAARGGGDRRGGAAAPDGRARPARRARGRGEAGDRHTRHPPCSSWPATSSARGAEPRCGRDDRAAG